MCRWFFKFAAKKGQTKSENCRYEKKTRTKTKIKTTTTNHKKTQERQKHGKINRWWYEHTTKEKEKNEQTEKTITIDRCKGGGEGEPLGMCVLIAFLYNISHLFNNYRAKVRWCCVRSMKVLCDIPHSILQIIYNHLFIEFIIIFTKRNKCIDVVVRIYWCIEWPIEHQKSSTHSIIANDTP